MSNDQGKVEYVTWESIYLKFKSLYPNKEDYVAYKWMYMSMEPRFICEKEGLEERIHAAVARFRAEVNMTEDEFTAWYHEDTKRQTEEFMKWVCAPNKEEKGDKG